MCEAAGCKTVGGWILERVWLTGPETEILYNAGWNFKAAMSPPMNLPNGLLLTEHRHRSLRLFSNDWPVHLPRWCHCCLAFYLCQALPASLSLISLVTLLPHFPEWLLQTFTYLFRTPTWTEVCSLLGSFLSQRMNYTESSHYTKVILRTTCSPFPSWRNRCS